MSLFKIEFHDGRTFHNLINTICKVTGSCQLNLKQNSMKIEAYGGLGTVGIKVDFNMDYIKEYFLDDSYESYFINFKNNSLPSKGSMKRNDALILSQEHKTDIINVYVLPDSKSSEGGRSFFHNEENSEENRLDLGDENDFTLCKMKLDRLCDIFKHASTVSNTSKVSFKFFEKGLKIDMKDSQQKTVWSSGEKLSGGFQSVEVEKNIISELAKLNTLHSESMCLITSYEDGGLLRIKLPVGCYATLEIYLIENIKENEE